jgi:uncharacterized OB-fold protein
MNFESELEKGNFYVSECSKCKKIVWPPSDICNTCLTQISWRKSSGEGKILEFSKQNENFFCVAEIENSIKIIGKIISGVPEIGKKISILDCKVGNQDYIFNLRVEN